MTDSFDQAFHERFDRPGESEASDAGSASEQHGGVQPFPFTLLRDVEIELESRFIIRDLVPYEALGEIYAPPGGGKTAVGIDMALHIAEGREYRRAAPNGSP